jgi:hypothetical protein
VNEHPGPAREFFLGKTGTKQGTIFMVRIIQPILSANETDALTRLLNFVDSERADYINMPPERRHDHIFRYVLFLRASGLVNGDAFRSDQVCSTPGALAALERTKQEPMEFLHRHFTCDWGDVSADDWEENDLSLTNGYRILSAYRTSDGERIWVITEADRSATTILLPSEY